ncbi:MAG: DUF4118 domain-containing protein, partial [Candidatus Omnitrophota bacterium]
KKEGVDVVAGYVETHNRAETDALLEGLEILPVKKLQYKNIEIREFDIDLALKRHPALILVDELAHSNAPGSRYLKRWQDVAELLEAGIDVYTTLNVQHCESANDVVAQVTGITVHETVPDTFLEKTEDIELVDLPPEDLLKRLNDGKVYLGDQAQRAVKNFFQIGNLIALRQLALQYTSRLVDAKMRSYKETYSVAKVWSVRDRFLVCIGSNPHADRLIRAGKRIASSLGVEWIVAHVDIPSQVENRKTRTIIAEMMRLAEKLGAETITLSGQNVSDVLISYARSQNITKIIIGKPGRPKWQEVIFGSVVNELARKCGEIDLYLLSGETQDQPIKFKMRPSKPFSWKGLAAAVFMVAVCTVVGKLLSRYLNSGNTAMIYLLAVALLAYRYGIRTSIIATLLSVLSFDYFFVPPYHTFQVADIKNDLITFVIIFSIGLIISILAQRLRQQAAAMSFRETRTQALYHLSRDLAKTSNPEELFQIAVFHIQKFFKCPVAIFSPDAAERLQLYSDNSKGLATIEKEQAVAQWVYEHKKIAGKDTDTLPGSKGIYLPLIGSEKIIGVIALFSREEKQFMDPEQLHMLEMFTNQGALAIEGAKLALAAVKAESDIENERLRNLILTTFSSELPKPLASISETASELLKSENIKDDSKRSALIEKMCREVESLNTLITELPKIIKPDK